MKEQSYKKTSEFFLLQTLDAKNKYSQTTLNNCLKSLMGLTEVFHFVLLNTYIISYIFKNTLKLGEWGGGGVKQ